ncbi:MAG: phosphomannomutase [Desulfovibrio sp.]|jgi:phosphomannomutase/phosphomannomutase/phosphoglucomutase|nr:phosphomannomutase [Desulfovibrio sp.]
MLEKTLSCFKAYDIRGRVPDSLDGSVAWALGYAFARNFAARSVVVGRDARLSGPALCAALAKGLDEGGSRVTDIGLCGTEEIYYAASRQGFDGGVMITGSHNPADENGFKLVRGGAVPVSADSGLGALKAAVGDLLNAAPPMQTSRHPPPRTRRLSFRKEYVRWLAEYSRAHPPVRNPLKILADAGNGCAGLVLAELAPLLPFELVFRQMEADGHFPNGVPNPLLPERREGTARAVRESGADMGIAFDGDFDRCFFYDSGGNFIEGYYCIGILAKELLRHRPGGKIIHDPRVYWNTREIVLAAGGVPVMGKTGHAFIKEKMRAENALYGGEMSAHHYFRDFAFCDSGMLPWLLVASLLSRTRQSLAELAAERMAVWPCSGEINRRVPDAGKVMQRIRDRYAADALHEDRLDGVNLEFRDWRFNLRMSNTEPILRLNVESRANRALLEDKTAELLERIDAHAG